MLDAASRKFGFGLELTHYDWSCETYKADRLDDAGRRAGPAGEVRLGAAGRGRLAGRAGSRVAVGPADPDPPRLRPVCEPAAVQAAARRAHAAGRPHRGRHRFLCRARKYRGRILVRRRPHVRRHRPRVRVAAERVLPRRHRPHPEIRLRTGDDAAEEASDVGHQVERHHPSPCRTGTSGSPRWAKRIPKSAPTSSTSTFCARISCSIRTGSMSLSDRTCSATS